MFQFRDKTGWILSSSLPNALQVHYQFLQNDPLQLTSKPIKTRLVSSLALQRLPFSIGSIASDVAVFSINLLLNRALTKNVGVRDLWLPTRWLNTLFRFWSHLFQMPILLNQFKYFPLNERYYCQTGNTNSPRGVIKKLILEISNMQEQLCLSHPQTSMGSLALSFIDLYAQYLQQDLSRFLASNPNHPLIRGIGVRQKAWQNQTCARQVSGSVASVNNNEPWVNKQEFYLQMQSISFQCPSALKADKGTEGALKHWIIRR